VLGVLPPARIRQAIGATPGSGFARRPLQSDEDPDREVCGTGSPRRLLFLYESQQAGLGGYFLDSLCADIDSLQLFAGIHARPLAGYYRALAKRFPFAIYYEVSGEDATVVAVLDCRKNPLSISNRLE
jgi:hypothetical protein